jgi:hypothetical protein
LIITKLFGGLGNQMFQYATGRRLAAINNDLLKLDITFFRGYHRPYCLNHLNIIEQIATVEEISYLKGVNHVREAAYFHFHSSVLELGHNIYLEGYWASEKYFKDIQETIRQEFTVKYPLADENKRLAETIGNCLSVAVHIRRGDYLLPPYNNFFVICPLSYYYEAANRLAAQFAGIHCFVFSDDPDWARQNLQFRFPTTFVLHNDQEKGYEDLRLMSFCDHHIIANSSFSWWGAWLAVKPDKIIFAPAKWNNDPGYITSNLLPESWQVI